MYHFLNFCQLPPGISLYKCKLYRATIIRTIRVHCGGTIRPIGTQSGGVSSAHCMYNHQHVLSVIYFILYLKPRVLLLLFTQSTVHACNAEDMCWFVQQQTLIFVYMHGDCFYKIKPIKGQPQRSCEKMHKMQLNSLLLSKHHDDINCGCAKGLNVRLGSDYFALSTSWRT